MTTVEEIAAAAEAYARSQTGETLRVFVFELDKLRGREGLEPEEAKRKGFDPGDSLPKGWESLTAEIDQNGRVWVVARKLTGGKRPRRSARRPARQRVTCAR